MNNEKKKFKVWWIVLIIIGCSLLYLVPFALIIYGIYMDTDTYKVLDNNEISINKGALTIKKEQNGYYNEKDNCYVVEGYLVNNKDKEYEYINISYTFYDNKGYTLGNSTSYLEKLDSKGTWKFKVNYCDVDSNEVNDFKFTSIDTY